MKKIRKVVIPAAGFGTRFLPQTKAMPKEMLPIVDKPVIQYVVEEAVAAGIEDVIIVTGTFKRAIEDHFDAPNADLIRNLERGGKEKLIEEVTKLSDLANFIYVRQKGPLGNATPILNARHIIGDEPFLVLWGDDFIMAEPSRTTQLIKAYEKYGSSVLSAMKKPSDEDSKRYGYVGGEEVEKGIIKVSEIIEKPGPEKKPSDYAIISGYIFTPEIFDCIDEMIAKEEKGAGGEYVYTDALNKLRERGQDVYAVEIENGKYYDTGNKLEYMKTVVELGLKHPDINGDFKKFLKDLLS
ncbi:MAG TPA: UTP--glucose-1-phosphate uridylyltransferase [Patescibacteria group bacterium]|nr:UTP--glucose-1-phosphate uridylyltransferase [Patescibacteria group bacterium]